MSIDELRVESFAGEAVAAHLQELAAMRLEVFREWPYLYEGTLAGEWAYLTAYAKADRNLVVVAYDGARVIGASTALPLLAHSQEVIAPLAAAGLEPSTICYFGESVLQPAYRGRGLGHRFFDEREAFARASGFTTAAFCAVQRADDDPRRPPDHHGHDRFWAKRGFVRRPDIVGTMSWWDVGDAAETAKPMMFWLKDLTR